MRLQALPRRLPRVGGWRILLHVVLVGWVLAAATIVLHSRDGRVADSVAGPLMLAFSAVGSAAAVRAATHRGLERRIRLAWWFMAVGYLLTLVSCVLFAAVPDFPGPGDVSRLGAVPFFLVGLLSLTSAPRSRAERVRAVLDVGVIVAGGFMALWYWSLGPLSTMDDVALSALAVAAAYPLADLALIFGAAAALLRGARSSARNPLIFGALGLTALVVADLQYASAAVHRTAAGVATEVSGTLQWMALLAGFGMLACAALEQCAGGAEVSGRADGRPAPTNHLLPYAAIAAGYGLLLVVAAGAPRYPWGGLIVGAVVMTALVVARQVLVLRQNHALLVTDYLTGVSTRAALGAALVRALAHTDRSGRCTAVLVIDMDGFKAVNDELGHDAGDELLRGFADLLRGTVAPADTVGRLGGDEFAVVLPDAAGPDDAVAVAIRLLDAMVRPLTVAGRPIVARASIGIALSRSGDTGRQVLHRADQAMYRAKRDATGWSLDATTPMEQPIAPRPRINSADGGVSAPVAAP